MCSINKFYILYEEQALYVLSKIFNHGCHLADRQWKPYNFMIKMLVNIIKLWRRILTDLYGFVCDQIVLYILLYWSANSYWPKLRLDRLPPHSSQSPIPTHIQHLRYFFVLRIDHLRSRYSFISSLPLIYSVSSERSLTCCRCSSDQTGLHSSSSSDFKSFHLLYSAPKLLYSNICVPRIFEFGFHIFNVLVYLEYFESSLSGILLLIFI